MYKCLRTNLINSDFSFKMYVYTKSVNLQILFAGKQPDASRQAYVNPKMNLKITTVKIYSIINVH